MPANYKTETVEGTSYIRCNQISIINPLGGDKVALFNEEKLAILNGQTIQLPLDIKRVGAVFNPGTANEQFPVLDLDTGEPTGAVLSFYDMYKHLHSLYIYLAKKRDAEMEQQP